MTNPAKSRNSAAVTCPAGKKNVSDLNQQKRSLLHCINKYRHLSWEREVSKTGSLSTKRNHRNGTHKEQPITEGNFGGCGKLHTSDWLFVLGDVPFPELRLVLKLSYATERRNQTKQSESRSPQVARAVQKSRVEQFNSDAQIHELIWVRCAKVRVWPWGQGLRHWGSHFYFSSVFVVPDSRPSLCLPMVTTHNWEKATLHRQLSKDVATKDATTRCHLFKIFNFYKSFSFFPKNIFK